MSLHYANKVPILAAEASGFHFFAFHSKKSNFEAEMIFTLFEAFVARKRVFPDSSSIAVICPDTLTD